MRFPQEHKDKSLCGRIFGAAETRLQSVGCRLRHGLSDFRVFGGKGLCGYRNRYFREDDRKGKTARIEVGLFSRVTLELADLLDFHPPEKYDAVIAFDSLWHVSHDRQKEIYAVVSSLMNIGGYFLFTHGDKDGSIVGEMFGERFYHSALDVEEVHALLAACGFSVLSSVENYKEETTGDRGLLVIAKKTV